MAEMAVYVGNYKKRIRAICRKIEIKSLLFKNYNFSFAYVADWQFLCFHNKVLVENLRKLLDDLMPIVSVMYEANPPPFSIFILNIVLALVNTVIGFM